MKKKSFVLALSALSAALLASSVNAAPGSVQPLAFQRSASSAPGLLVNLPVVGRLAGGGGVLYTTSVDVSNNSGNSMAVSFTLNAIDLVTASPIPAVNGQFVSPGSSTLLFGRGTVHFDDFIDTLVQQGLLDPQAEAHGVLGSMQVNFTGAAGSGQGTAQARFFSSGCSGTIGVSAAGQEITGVNATSLVGIFRDTRGEPGVPQIYSNMFLNNVGTSPNGQFPGTDVTVELVAYDSATAAVVGTVPAIPIAAHQTVVVSDVLHTLGVPAGEDTVIVIARITTGTSSIEGLAVQLDSDTHDGSSTPMADAGID